MSNELESRDEANNEVSGETGRESTANDDAAFRQQFLEDLRTVLNSDDPTTPTGDERVDDEDSEPEYLEVLNGTQGSKAYRTAVQDYDPNFNRPQHAEYYRYSDPDIERDGWF